MDYNAYIREVPDFPKPGILFKDLTTLWKDPAAFKSSIDGLYDHCRDKNINKVVGPESRGFIFGAPLAYLLGAGFVPARKPGKLPAETVSLSYALEYGEAALEIHKDSISEGDRVLIIDDLLATGGTVGAMIGLVEKLGGKVVECVFMVELEGLNGRKNIKYPVFSIIKS
ncbi:MAG: adenine phosphoribosyltransferase [Brevinematales bacterium]|jgi:adenine phosphoribosyltransferase